MQATFGEGQEHISNPRRQTFSFDLRGCAYRAEPSAVRGGMHPTQVRVVERESIPQKLHESLLKGRLSPRQKEFQFWCLSHGYGYVVVRSVEDAVTAVTEYLMEA